jgi:glutamate 5-kinase
MPKKSIVVVKVGSNTLTQVLDDGSESLDEVAFIRIAKQIKSLVSSGVPVVIVSSAAITAGMARAGLKIRPDRHTATPELQRLASIGWRDVLNAWDKALGIDVTVAEFLITKTELDIDKESNELMEVVSRSIGYGDVIVANENDTVTHAEIRYGDNDTLGAVFAVKIAQSMTEYEVKYVILSDIDGLLRDVSDPSSLISRVDNIDAYQLFVKGTNKMNGTGGMSTKFDAARICIVNDVDMWIASGSAEDAIGLALCGKIGTHFIAK